MRVLWVIHTDGSETPRISLEGAAGLTCERVEDPLAGLERLGVSSYDAVLADFPLPGWTPEEWLEAVQRLDSLVPVIIRDERPSCDDAIRLARLGAYYVLSADASPEKQARALEEALQYRRQRELALCAGEPGREPWKKFLVGESRAMRETDQLIRLIAGRRCTVLIAGETGTGKEMVGRAIHLASQRSHVPMVAVNCHALPESLLEAELFGHVKGAFTGAVSHRVGRFELANHSTLFLDEVGDLPLSLQAKLLRVLQEWEIQRLGSSESIPLDVRVLAATNQELAAKVAVGAFREDLYYRLNVVPMRVPPLRERTSDIPLLVYHFVEKVCRREDLPARQVSRDTLDRLSDYSWPGNVRQLENAVEMAILLAGDRKHLYPGDFSLPPAQRRESAPPVVREYVVPDEGLDFERTVSAIERSILTQALQRTGGNKKQAAELLRLKRTTLAAKLKSLQMVGV